MPQKGYNEMFKRLDIENQWNDKQKKLAGTLFPEKINADAAFKTNEKKFLV